MTIIAIACLVIAAGCTAIMVPTVANARSMSGPDTMGIFLVFVVMGARWAALAGAVAVVAWRSGWPWLGASRGGQAALGLGFLALAGGASLASIVLAFGPDSDAVKAWAYVFAVGFPAVIIAAAAFTLAGPGARLSADAWRGGAAVLVVLMAWGGWSMWRVDRARSAESERQTAAVAAALEKEHQARLAAVAAMGPHTPLGEWLPWLDSNDHEVQERALNAVRARPTLNADLTQMLRGPDAVRALRFIWLWMPEARLELAAPVRDAIAAMPAWATSFLDAPHRPVQELNEDPAVPPARAIDLSTACESVVAVATYYDKSGVDLAGPMRALYETVQARALPEERYAEDWTYQCRGYLKSWLDEHTKQP